MNVLSVVFMRKESTVNSYLVGNTASNVNVSVNSSRMNESTSVVAVNSSCMNPSTVTLNACTASR